MRPPGIRTLIGLCVLNHVAFAAARVTLTLSALHLQTSTLGVGLMMSMFSVLPMLLALAGGRWVDRIGARFPMLLGSFMLACGLMLPVFSLQQWMLDVAAVVIGVGFLPFHLALQKLISQLASGEERRHNLSLMTIGFSVSAFLGPISSGFMIDGLGHRPAFATLSVLPLAALVWLYRLRHRLPDRRGVPAEDFPARDVFDLLRTPELRRLYLVVSLISAAWEVHQFLVPLYGAQAGLSASGIGLILGGFSIATLVVRLVVPLFLMDVPEWRAILAALGISAVVYALYPSFSSLEALIGLSFLLGLGLGVSQPMVLSIMARSAPAERLGEATGLRLTLVYGTQTALPSAFGAMGSLLGIGAMFWGMALLLGSALLGVGRSVTSKPPAPPEPPH